MSGLINSIGSGASSSASASSNLSSVQKLTDDTKSKLQALGVDTSTITSEAQGQIALLQAQQQQQAQGGEKHHGGAGKAEMDSLKSEATSLASKLGISVSADEKLSDIMAAIGPAVDAKVSAAGSDQTKIAEAQELQAEFSTISSSLSTMEAQRQQGAKSTQAAQGAQAIDSSLANMATQNKIYHQVGG